jgi:purine catabolism regulator
LYGAAAEVKPNTASGFGLPFGATVWVTADEMGMPLLEVPLQTPFIAVVRAVTERLAELQYEGVVRASRVQPRMTRAALRAGPAGVLRELGTALRGRAVLLGEDGTVQLAVPPEAGEPAREAFRTLGLAPDVRRPTSSASAGPHGVLSTQTIRVGRRLHCHLVVTTDGALGPADHLLLGHAASLIALDREKPLRLREEQAQVTSLVLALVLDGALDPVRSAQQLAAAGLPARGLLTVLVLDGDGALAALDALDDVLLREGLPRTSIERDGCVVVVVPHTPEGAADAALGAVLRRRGETGFHVGRALADGLSRIAEAVRDARAAARVARLRDRAVVDAAELGGTLLASDPAAGRRLEQLAERLVGPLAEHDRAAGSQLVDTALAFLEHHGQLEAAAGALGVHRHTVRARMDRIGALLRSDLDSAHVRAELLLALTAWHRRER